ncbi:MAG: sulfatase-like hydrolase/transferase, partial [Alphaproteobacteria bacterium]|nr:sulfatase-like hydrolase/transferase [Alphaproteobacteria bacterium]
MAPPLAMLFPLIGFLRYHGYELDRPEALLALGLVGGVAAALGALASAAPSVVRVVFYALVLLVVADVSLRLGHDDRSQLMRDWGLPVLALFVWSVVLGLMVVLSSLRAHLGLIFTAVFATMTLGVIGLPAEQKPEGVTIDTNEAAAAETRSRPDGAVVHIVLDEHIGLAGFPGEVAGAGEAARFVRDFYLDNGFAVFGHAYSEYAQTFDSIPNLLNGIRPLSSGAGVRAVGPRYAAPHNAWFDRLARDGYTIRVYQSDYLNLCEHGGVGFCFTYSTNGAYPLRELDLPSGIKARLILGKFYKDTLAYDLAGMADAASGGVLSRALLPEPWRGGAVGEPQTGPAASMPVIDRLVGDIRANARGRAFFAHLILPHFSYQFDRSCRLKGDFRTWLNRMEDWVSNTPGSRLERYQAYLEQVRCTTLQMGRVFDALKDAGAWENATVIVHGDHGSRIASRTPNSAGREAFTERDWLDLHSTFIAVKRPGATPRYDTRQRSIRTIFAEQSGQNAQPDAPRPEALIGDNTL